MANACPHSFTMIKSDSTLVQWMCSFCHSGPAWFIFQCKYCNIKVEAFPRRIRNYPT
ncbi:unnamed protein product [Clonostachys solani]|uniref:Uncharacterized protein n=1 Tax=Clonostachys solani TaxID=160281 RepID=A0A9N9Z3T4_9HYPO|nr:unnamed protein product [Clonostachys solani]